jgi:hypothetical protein
MKKFDPSLIEAARAVVWINGKEKRVKVMDRDYNLINPDTRNNWCDPIGAAYTQWREMKDEQRLMLMLETAVDLTLQGFDLKDILRAFAEVRQFRDLGNKSYPMCRALTSALVGRCLEPNTMSFESLLERYSNEKETIR